MGGGGGEKIITLVPRSMAKRGFRFIHEGDTENCRGCELRRVCVENLEIGRVYEVLDVRRKRHKCRLIDDYVYVVEVAEAPIEALIGHKAAIEGVITTFTPSGCYSCEHSSLCNPQGLKGGDRVRIERVLDKVECRRSGSLVKVILRRTSSSSP